MQPGKPRTRVEELRVRVEGTDPRAAGRLGRRVTELVAEGIPDHSGGRIGAVSVRVPAGGTEEATARRIARAIRGGIR